MHAREQCMSKKSRSERQNDGQSTEESHQGNNQPELTRSRDQILEVILACLLAYLACFTLRILEFPAWQADQFSIHGQYLMATHDAYVWLAGAEGINRKTGAPLSQMLAILHELTGFNLANIGFWLPAFLSPLVVLPIVLLGWREKQPEVGIASGIMAAGCLGFLMRTRLGFLDTDVLTLFFPVAVASGLIICLSAICRKRWRSSRQQEDEKPVKLVFFLVGILITGLLVQGYEEFYGKVQIAFALIGMSFLIGLILVSKDRLPSLIFGFGLLIAVGFAGWSGLILGLIAIGMALWRPSLLDKWLPVGIILGLALIISGDEILSVTYGGLDKILGYAKISPSEITENATLSLPAIAQSVREAQNINWGSMASRSAGNWWIFWLGILGLAYLIYKRPMYIIWLPLLGLSLASVKLGNRFSMFGGAALGIGLAFGFNQLLLDLKQPRWSRWVVQILLCLAVIWPMWKVADSVRPAPILPKVYAQTFMDLQEETPGKAQLWQWWDYGYAGQYYAHRRTFGDGGKHSGEYLYPLAKVHATNSMLQASQMVKLVASTQMKEMKELQENGTIRYPEVKAPFYPGDPVQRLRDMGPKKAKNFVRSLKSEKKDWPEDLPEQYLVLSWENLRLAYWISFYGNWNLESGQGSPGRIQQIQGRLSFDLEKGIIKMSRGQVELEAMDILESQGTRHMKWSNGTGIYAVLNRFSNELFLMDAKIYKSMMIQMLISDPDDFSDHFELVSDHYPWARAYRVK